MEKFFLTVQSDLVMILYLTVYTSLMRVVDCLVFFFLMLSSSVVLSSNMKMSFSVVFYSWLPKIVFTAKYLCGFNPSWSLSHTACIALSPCPHGQQEGCERKVLLHCFQGWVYQNHSWLVNNLLVKAKNSNDILFRCQSDQSNCYLDSLFLSFGEIIW